MLRKQNIYQCENNRNLNKYIEVIKSEILEFFKENSDIKKIESILFKEVIGIIINRNGIFGLSQTGSVIIVIYSSELFIKISNLLLKVVLNKQKCEDRFDCITILEAYLIGKTLDFAFEKAGDFLEWVYCSPDPGGPPPKPPVGSQVVDNEGTVLIHPDDNMQRTISKEMFFTEFRKVK